MWPGYVKVLQSFSQCMCRITAHAYISHVELVFMVPCMNAVSSPTFFGFRVSSKQQDYNSCSEPLQRLTRTLALQDFQADGTKTLLQKQQTHKQPLMGTEEQAKQAKWCRYAGSWLQKAHTFGAQIGCQASSYH